jgi:drug/metabolite transporter (DMT)-like permease
MLAAGLIAGIVASVLFNLGIALQAIEARRAPRAEELRATLIWDLLHRPRWVAGLLVEWVGVPLEILAFAWAPFVVVQPLLACGLLVLLAVAHRLLGERPSTGALVGVGLIIAGIALIAWGAPGEQDTHRGGGAVIAVVAGLVLASFVPFALRGRRLDTALTAVLGSACGFAATNVAMKLMADDFGNDHFLQAGGWLAVAAVAGFAATVTGMTALQRAPATTVIPISTAVQTFLPVALEPLFLRESFRDASLDGVPLLVGIAVMLVGIVALARTRHVSALAAGTPAEAPRAAPPGGPPGRGTGGPPGTGAIPSAP